jgi:6-phosphofructokinase 1
MFTEQERTMRVLTEDGRERRVAFLTSGGDAPGMNAALRAGVLAALEAGWVPIGIRTGFRGLIAGTLGPMGYSDVATIVSRGGTVLGSARCPELADPAVRIRGRAVLAAAGVEALVVIGGDGSMRGAAALADAAGTGPAPRVVGVPASIDNDLPASCAIGADTALNTIVDACDRIGDTADSHDRVFIVEVMGRDCGWLAVHAAEAVGADAVLYPEAGRGEDAIVDDIVAAIRRARGRDGRRALVIKAEGVAVPTERIKIRVDAALAAAGMTVETRTVILGHLVRGGAPTAFDRVLATRLGRAATKAAMAGADRVMVAWRPPAIGPSKVPLPEGVCRFVELDHVSAAVG